MIIIDLVKSRILIFLPAVISNYFEYLLSWAFLNKTSEKIDAKHYKNTGETESSNEFANSATSYKNFSTNYFMNLLFLNTKYFFKILIENSLIL